MTKINTTDATIRRAIRAELISRHAGEDAVIVDELKVSLGSGRLDVAVINGRIEGYEIKSDRDSLDRLPRQAAMFGAIAERMTLVVGQRHVEKASAMIPEWWAIVLSTTDANGLVTLKKLRRGRLNRAQDKIALIEALERDEIVALLASEGIDRGYRGENQRFLAHRAAANVARERVSLFVKSVLKARCRLALDLGDLAFGRSVIDCAAPSASYVDLSAPTATAMDG